jgi:hypothetical protein
MVDSSGHVPPPAAAKAAPAPFGVSDLFELSLHALVRPAASFRAAAARPAPSFTASSSLALAYCAAAIANPRFLDGYARSTVIVMAAAALGVCASLWLLAAIALYAVGRMFAGHGEFDRGLQGATALAVTAPLLAVCNPLPYYGWLAPALLLGWVSAGALEGLFGASTAPSRALSTLLAVACAAALAGARRVADRAPEIETAALLASPGAPIGADFSRLQTISMPDAPGGNPATDSTPASGLDLLRVPDDIAAGGSSPAAPAAAATAGPGAAALQSPAGDVQQNTLAMLDRFAPLLNNPQLTKNMTPEQKAQFKELNALISKLRVQIAANKPLSPAQLNDEMMDIQKLVFKVMVGQAMNKQGLTATDVTPPQPPNRKRNP